MASDGKEYRWGHHMVADHEWTVGRSKFDADRGPPFILVPSA